MRVCVCASVGCALLNLICICVVATPRKFTKLMKKQPSVLPTYVGSAGRMVRRQKVLPTFRAANKLCEEVGGWGAWRELASVNS